jgi:hypothetical protein
MYDNILYHTFNGKRGRVLKVSFCELNGVKFIRYLAPRISPSAPLRDVSAISPTPTNETNYNLGIRNAEQLRHRFLEEPM